LYKEGLTLFQEQGIMDGIVSGLVRFAQIATEQAQTRRAAQLLGVAEALCESRPDVLTPDLQVALEQERAAVRAQLGETAWAVAWAKGQAMTMNQAIAYALDNSI
jgi:non-specific serine/threonine protein kinase